MTLEDEAPPVPRKSAWLFYTLLAIALWGVWGIVSKMAEKELPPASIQVISTIGVVLPILLLLLSPRLKVGKSFLAGGLAAFCTGLCGSVGNLTMLMSFKHGGEASTVLPLTSMFPLVTIVLAVLLLRERINWIQAAGIVVALVAFYLFGLLFGGATKADASWWQKFDFGAKWMRYALVSLVLWGIAAVLQKVATNRISTELATVLFALAFIPVAVMTALIEPVSWKISPQAWVLAIGFGALIGIGTLILFAAYRDGKASIVTALYALYPAVTVMLARPILGEKIVGLMWVAIALALVAGVMLSYERPAKAA
jgi:uncharacterized membrane protein